MLATPIAQANANIVMTLQGHISEHIGLMAEMQAQQEVTANLPPEAQMMLQQDPMMQQQIQAEIDNRAAVLIGELTEQYAQAVAPAENTDPLVAIRQQELALRGAEIHGKGPSVLKRSREWSKRKSVMTFFLHNNALICRKRQMESVSGWLKIVCKLKRDIAAANLRNRRQ